MFSLMLMLIAAEPRQMPPPKLLVLNFRARLRIELTEDLERVAPGTGLMNRQAPRSAKLRSLSLETYDENEAGNLVPLTAAQLSEVLYPHARLTLRSYDVKVDHVAPNGKHFTAADMIKVLEATERTARTTTTRGGDSIDAHHVFLEFIMLGRDGVWDVYWGS